MLSVLLLASLLLLGCCRFGAQQHTGGPDLGVWQQGCVCNKGQGQAGSKESCLRAGTVTAVCLAAHKSSSTVHLVAGACIVPSVVR